MDLRSYLAIIRKYLPIIVGGALIGLLAGFAIYATTPKQYAADVTFYVSTPVPEQANAQAVGTFAAGRMVSYAELLQSEDLAARVVKQQNLDVPAAAVAKEITANTTTQSVLITARVTDTDKARALKISQGLAETFGPMVDQLDNAGRKTPLVTINTVSEPRLKAAPVAPKSKTLLGMGLGLGLLLSLVYALLRELLNNAVKNDEELRQHAGAPVIGAVVADPSANGNPLLTVSNHANPRAEEHRKIRTNLAFIDAAQPARVITVTAPMPGDGATTVAANTALSFAETGERVCLVGADLRDGGAGELFGVGGPGLSAVLSGTTDLAGAVRASRTEPRIDVLPAGELPPNPASLLGQARFNDLVAQLRSSYDRVVIDTPALLPVADAATVAAQSDGVVLVVREGATTAKQVDSARSALEAVNARTLGVVNNRARAEGNRKVRSGRR